VPDVLVQARVMTFPYTAAARLEFHSWTGNCSSRADRLAAEITLVSNAILNRK
jgi:hypothetical protein